MKRRALVFGVVTVLGGALAPALATAAVKKIPVTVTFTEVDDVGGLVGVVESPNAKCVGGKDVHDRYPNQRISTETDSQGKFTISTEFLAELEFASFEATVAKGQKFGPRGKKKQCQPDSAHVETSPPERVDVLTFGFNDASDTFSGTLESGEPDCEDAATLGLQRYVQPDFFPDRVFTSGPGAFSYPYGSQPQSGFWYLQAEAFIGASTFGPDGGVSVTYCDPGAFVYTQVP